MNGQQRRARAIAARALWGIWDVCQWGWRQRRWTLACALVGFIGWAWSSAKLTVLAVVAYVIPAAVAVVWASRWPVSFERVVAGPWWRWRWRRWARRNWPHLARESGLSLQRENRKGEPVWVAPRLMDVLTDGWVLTVRVQARVGQTVADLKTAVPAIATAAGAVSWRSISRSPSGLDMVLQMADPLAGTRPANPAATRGLAVTVGRCEDATDLVIDLADPWHVAIQGMTRSGKSALTYALLAGLADRREAIVCGLDPTGILLGPWAHKMGADLRHIGTADMAGAGEVVARIVALMDQRIAYLMGAGLDKIPAPTPDLPVLVVVLEEYPGMLAAAEADDTATGRKPAERIAPKIRAGVRRLIQEGAKAGIRVVLLAQRMDANIVGGAERSNLGTRITLRVDNADAVRMLHTDVTSDLVRELAATDPGRAIIDTPGHPTRWAQTDLLNYPDYLTAVRGSLTPKPVTTADAVADEQVAADTTADEPTPALSLVKTTTQDTSDDTDDARPDAA